MYGIHGYEVLNTLLMYCTTRKERSVRMVCMEYLDTEILNTFTNVLYY